MAQISLLNVILGPTDIVYVNPVTISFNTAGATPLLLTGINYVGDEFVTKH